MTNIEMMRKIAWTSEHVRKDGTHKQKGAELPIFPRSGNTDYTLAFAMEKPEWQLKIKNKTTEPLSLETILNAKKNFEEPFDVVLTCSEAAHYSNGTIEVNPDNVLTKEQSEAIGDWVRGTSSEMYQFSLDKKESAELRHKLFMDTIYPRTLDGE